MPQHYHWIDERERRRREHPEEDFGQADYSTDYAYDERYRTGHRVPEEERGYRARDDDGPGYRAGYDDEPPPRRRRGRGYEDEGDYHYVGGREPPRRRHDEDERLDYERREARRYRDDDPDPDRDEEPRSWMDQAREGVASFFHGDEEGREERRYRQGRVLWAVIEGRLDHERGLDASDIEVIVDGTEVTLNGTVRSREDKRRAEDLAEVRGVRDVRNNLRVRGSRGWWR